MAEILDNTLADFPPESFTILALCGACGHQAAVERENVPDWVTRYKNCRCGCAAVPAGPDGYYSWDWFPLFRFGGQLMRFHLAIVSLVLVLLSDAIGAAVPQDGGFGFEVEKIDDHLYALVGPLTDRTPENLSNNATYGVIVTAEGVVLVDAGGTYQGARRIHRAVQSLTDQPIKIVINTNSQDHRWLGNGYFKQIGARIIAHRGTVEDQKARLNDMLLRLSNTVGDAGMEGTVEAYADEVFEDRTELKLGGVKLELYPMGQAHTRSDIVVWLPQERVLFSGDIVYTERMLSVRPYSNSGSWLRAFEQMAAFNPGRIVPGHGHVTQLATARKDTYSYLQFLREAVRDLMDGGGDMTDLTSIDQSAFAYLKNYEVLKGRNAQQVYQELEWE